MEKTDASTATMQDVMRELIDGCIVYRIRAWGHALPVDTNAEPTREVIDGKPILPQLVHSCEIPNGWAYLYRVHPKRDRYVVITHDWQSGSVGLIGPKDSFKLWEAEMALASKKIVKAAYIASTSGMGWSFRYKTAAMARLDEARAKGASPASQPAPARST